MTALRVLLSRATGWLVRRRRSRELDEEIALHLDLLAEEQRRTGQPPAMADAAARRAFGARLLVKETYLEQLGFPVLDTFARDLRRALAALRRSPTSSAVIVLTLAIGIGAVTAIFSIVDGVLLRRAPFEGFDRLVMVWETDRNSGTRREPGSVPDFLDYQERSGPVHPLAAFTAASVTLTLRAEDPRHLAALRASSQLLPLLGVRPIVGRAFGEADDRPDVPVVALISEALWTREFGRDPQVVGRAVQIDDRPATVIGVVPTIADFGVLQILARAAYARSFADRSDRPRVDVWLPLQPNPQAYPRATHPLLMLGRLRPGASVASAQDALSSLAAELERAYPENAHRGIHVEPLEDVVFGPIRPALLVLLGAVVLVLFVACTNVVNLLLARGARRLPEVALQSALGASTLGVARQFLVEGLLLTLAGGAAGLALAHMALAVLLGAAPHLPRIGQVAIDPRVLIVTVAVCSGVGLLCGLVPTLQARASDLQPAMNRGGSTWASAGRRLGAARATLVVGELAMSVMLLVGATLLIRSFWLLQQVDPGFQSEGVLKVEYQLPPSRYPADFQVFPDFKEMHAFTATLVERAAALPGVRAAAAAGNHPLDPGYTNSFVIVGREAEAKTAPELSIRRVTSGYFDTVGLRVVSGRRIEDSDTTSGTPVILLNESAVRRFFPNQDPIGAHIRFWGASRRVVGVVADEHTHGPATAAPLAAYTPLTQTPSTNGDGVLLIRTVGDPNVLASALPSLVRTLDATIPVFGIEPLDVTLSRSVADRRFAAWLLGALALTAAALAAVGIYGVFRYNVERRTREMGIRLVLGAPPGQALRLLLTEGLRLTAAGITVGAIGAWALSRFLRALLFGVTPTDPLAFATVIAVLGAVALGATFLAARHVLQVTPLVALRAD